MSDPGNRTLVVLGSTIPLDNNTIEDTETHELRIDGHHLIEKTQNTLTHIDGIDGKTLIVVTSRSIDDKSLKITLIVAFSIVFSDGGPWEPQPQVETDMTEDEVKKFEEDWTNLWDPRITQNDFWQAQ